MFTVKEWSYLLGKMVEVLVTNDYYRARQVVTEGRETGRMRFVYNQKGSRVYIPWDY